MGCCPREPHAEQGLIQAPLLNAAKVLLKDSESYSISTVHILCDPGKKSAAGFTSSVRFLKGLILPYVSEQCVSVGGGTVQREAV